MSETPVGKDEADPDEIAQAQPYQEPDDEDGLQDDGEELDGQVTPDES